MSGWLGALAHGGVGATRGFMNTYEFMQKMQDRERALKGEEAFGATLQSMYNPQPQAPAGPSPNPMQAPMRSPAPTALAPQIPGASSIGSSMPGPEQAPMRGGGAPTQLGYDFETYERPQPPQQLDWKTLLTALSKQPGIDKSTISLAMDRALPMMNAQSQMEWREMSGRIKMLENERKTSADATRADQGQQRIDLGKENLVEKKRANDARIKKINTSIDTAAREAKLNPEVKATLDVHKLLYSRTATAVNVAQKNLQSAQFEGKPENIQAAQQDVAEAEAAMNEAQSSLMAFVNKKMPGANISLDEAAPAPAAAPAAAPKPGAVTPAKFTTTKAGNKAQASGFESPQYMPQTKPPGTKPAPMASPAAPAAALPNKTPKISAQPSPSQPAKQPKPLPKSKTMMVQGEEYIVRGNTYVWDGAQLVLKRGKK